MTGPGRQGLLAGIAVDADAVLELVRGRPDADFQRPTPCPAWDVAHLLAHLVRDFERVPEGLDAGLVVDAPIDADRLSYWRYDRAENQVGTQRRAVEIMGRFGSPAAVVDGLEAMVDAALRTARDAPARALVRVPWGWVMDLDELLATRWVGLAVHSLDLTSALGVPDAVSDEGLAFTVGVLDGLAGRPLSAERGLPPADYIRAATGRTPDPDPAFPLLA
ncbi:MAG: hypothetical protein QOK43_1181 [Acidimicrobiaceae bacterium]|nr:hypothetical protein [Acidimicrobiaceae bacterium]